ncbi:hypothetical protein E1162_06260 [Rhodobacteraceae bacterium RKSG542]|uniref:hypothetical protein n=1 Tax=Pseudovibrio flavus TaxID=2529854 RepID=UPI0012BBC139|nr:hypothetical protein [Pseudovibrio flavus]MTI16837.1 hypothetical protein [Pseudovibrio flavus]
MATTMFFEEYIRDQNGKGTLTVEFGRSSYYAGCTLKDGSEGESSIYLNVDGKLVIMDIETAKKFVSAAVDVGEYFGLLD